MLTVLEALSVEAEDYHLGNVDGERKRDGQPQTLQRPDLDTLHVFPRAHRRGTSVGHETHDCANLNPSHVRPLLLEHGVDDEDQTIREVGQCSKGKKGEDKRVTWVG